jgi:hypothetical protein
MQGRMGHMGHPAATGGTFVRSRGPPARRITRADGSRTSIWSTGDGAQASLPRTLRLNPARLVQSRLVPAPSLAPVRRKRLDGPASGGSHRFTRPLRQACAGCCRLATRLSRQAQRGRKAGIVAPRHKSLWQRGMGSAKRRTSNPMRRATGYHAPFSTAPPPSPRAHHVSRITISRSSVMSSIA